MSSSVKDALLKSINARVKRVNKIKEKTSASLTPQDIVLMFLDNTVSLYQKDTQADFQHSLNMESKLLGSRLATFDPNATVELLWDDAPIDEPNEWKRLRLNGVKITWSAQYAEKNNLPVEQVINIFDIILGRTS